MMQPSTTMMKIVAFLSCSVRYSNPQRNLETFESSLSATKFRPGIAFTICTNLDKSVPFTEKWREKYTWNWYHQHEFPFGTFRPGKQDYLFRCSVAPGNLPLERPLKCFYFPTGFSGNLKGKQPQSWAKWGAKLRNVSRFASVEDLKEQLLDKWCSSEDRYCKVLASWTVFVCLFFAKVKIAFL